jgi:para-nitrobenzyl esterase
VRERFVEFAEPLLALYPTSSDAEAGERQKEFLRDALLGTLVDFATFRARFGRAKHFGYLLERSMPWPEHPRYQAFHSSELPYMFNNLSALARPWVQVDHDLARVMSSYWANFIRTGNPNGDGLPEWPSVPDQVMRLGAESKAGPALTPDKARGFFAARQARER